MRKFVESHNFWFVEQSTPRPSYIFSLKIMELDVFLPCVVLSLYNLN